MGCDSASEVETTPFVNLSRVVASAHLCACGSLLVCEPNEKDEYMQAPTIGVGGAKCVLAWRATAEFLLRFAARFFPTGTSAARGTGSADGPIWHGRVAEGRNSDTGVLGGVWHAAQRAQFLR